MNLETQQKHFADMVERMRDILFKKGNDYANQDRLSNFKLAGTIAGGKAETNCLNLIATKVARLGVLLNSDGPPNNESIRDSIIDLANYAVLLDMIVAEGEKEELPMWDADGVPHDLIAGRLIRTLVFTSKEVKEATEMDLAILKAQCQLLERATHIGGKWYDIKTTQINYTDTDETVVEIVLQKKPLDRPSTTFPAA